MRGKPPDWRNTVQQIMLMRVLNMTSALAADGSEPVRVVLGDVDLTLTEVEDVMDSTSLEQLELAALGSDPRGSARCPLASSPVGAPRAPCSGVV